MSALQYDNIAEASFIPLAPCTYSKRQASKKSRLYVWNSVAKPPTIIHKNNVLIVKDKYDLYLI